MSVVVPCYVRDYNSNPLSFFAVFKLVINLKFVVVPSYARDYDSKSFVVLCGV